MKYDIKAIPTTYAGVQFRSRLEARWAAFFDLCKWSWEYEPFDLEGWAPDFSIKKKNGGRVLIEVKPYDFRHWSDARGQHDAITSAFSKCLPHVEEKAPYEIETNSILLLGSGPFYGEKWKLAFVGMWASEYFGETSLYSVALVKDQSGTDMLPVSARGLLEHKWEGVAPVSKRTCFCTMPQPQLIDDNEFRMTHPVRAKELELLWREAGNAVQWKPS